MRNEHLKKGIGATRTFTNRYNHCTSCFDHYSEKLKTKLKLCD